MYLNNYLFKKVPMSELSKPIPEKYFTQKINTLPNNGMNYQSMYDTVMALKTPDGFYYYPIKSGLETIHIDFPLYFEEITKNIKSAGKLLAKLSDMKVNNEQNQLLISLEKEKLERLSLQLQNSLALAKNEQDRIFNEYNTQKEKYEQIINEKDTYIATLKNKIEASKNQALGDMPFNFFDEALTPQFYEFMKEWQKQYYAFVMNQNPTFMESSLNMAKDYLFNMINRSYDYTDFATDGLPTPQENPAMPLFSELFNLTQIPYDDVELTSLQPYVDKIMKVINYNPHKLITMNTNTQNKYMRAFNYLYKFAYEGTLNKFFLGEYRNLMLNEKQALIDTAISEMLVNNQVDLYVAESNAIIERLNSEKDSAINTVAQLQEAMLQAKLKFEQSKEMSNQKETQLNELKTENQTLLDQIKAIEDQLLDLMSQFEAKQARLIAEEMARQLELEKAQQALSLPETVFEQVEEPIKDEVHPIVTPESDAIMKANEKAQKQKLIKRAGIGVAVAYGLYSLLG